MAKPQQITKNNNPWRWRWRSFKNWFYDKWMRFRGYTPLTFEPYTNSYNYVKRSEIDVAINEAEDEPEYEEVFYQRQPSAVWYRDKEKDITARMAVAKALREGRDDARIIRGPLPRS